MESLDNISKQSVMEMEPEVQSVAFSDSDRLLIFIMEGGILSTICVTGFILNLLALIVLIRERKDFTFEQRCLAFFDMMFLALAFLTLGLPNLSQHYRKTLFLDFINPLFGLLHTFRVGSVCITVCLNIQRVFGLVFTHRSPPFLQRHLASILIVMSILYNIPKYFEFRVNEMSHVVTTDLRKNPVYISIYVFGSKFVLFELIPYITVLVCNVAIITKLKESSSFRRAHSFYQGRPSIVEVEGSSFRTKATAQRQGSLKAAKRGSVPNSSPSKQAVPTPLNARVKSEETSLGHVLVCLSSIFIVCQSIKIIPDVYELHWCRAQQGQECFMSGFSNAMIRISHIFVAFNSLANCIIYFFMGSKFKVVWTKTFKYPKFVAANDAAANLRRQSHMIQGLNDV